MGHCCCGFADTTPVKTKQSVYEQEGQSNHTTLSQCVIQHVNEDSLQNNQRFSLRSGVHFNKIVRQDNTSSKGNAVQVKPTESKIEISKSKEFEVNPHQSTVTAMNQELRNSKEFRKLALTNHQKLIQCLEKQGKQNKYIAQHTLLSQIKSNQEGKLQFKFSVEKGHDEFKNSETTPQTNLLWNCGRDEVINLIECLVKGILELESEDLFHLDLTLKNIIRRGKDGKLIYKIIDFGFAYKVREGKEDCSAFKSTKAIIAYLLTTNFTTLKQQLFSKNQQDIDPTLSESLTSIWSSKQSIDEKVMSIAAQLPKQSLIFHKKQFVAILKQILDPGHCKVNWKDINNYDLVDNEQWYKTTLEKLKKYLNA